LGIDWWWSAAARGLDPHPHRLVHTGNIEHPADVGTEVPQHNDLLARSRQLEDGSDAGRVEKGEFRKIEHRLPSSALGGERLRDRVSAGHIEFPRKPHHPVRIDSRLAWSRSVHAGPQQSLVHLEPHHTPGPFVESPFRRDAIDDPKTDPELIGVTLGARRDPGKWRRLLDLDSDPIMDIVDRSDHDDLVVISEVTVADYESGL
jgi:hypothetical protein